MNIINGLIFSFSTMCLYGEWYMLIGPQTNIRGRDYYDLSWKTQGLSRDKKDFSSVATVNAFSGLALDLNLIHLWRTTGPFKMGFSGVLNAGKAFFGEKKICFNVMDDDIEKILNARYNEAFLHVCFAVIYETKYMDILMQSSVMSFAYDRYLSKNRERKFILQNDIDSVSRYFNVSFISKSKRFYQQDVSVYLQFSILNSSTNGSCTFVSIGCCISPVDN